MFERDTKGDATHSWWIFDNIECCKACGIVRRADRQHKPCVGPVKISLRIEANV